MGCRPEARRDGGGPGERRAEATRRSVTSRAGVAPALHALMARVVDYAGLFPPARLEMAEAVRAYAAYRDGAEAWALGRFVIPAARLDEFDAAAAGLVPTTAADSWALSALLGASVEADLAGIEAYNDRHRDARLGAVHVDTVELRASHPEQILLAGEHVSGRYDAFIEVPVADDPAALIDAIARIGVKAKIRTGGTTPDAFPRAGHVVRFIRRCVERDVAFKATAGLHHALRSEYPLTYDVAAPRGVMFGFLNVFLVAAFMRDGLDDAGACALLEEGEPGAIRFDGDSVRWRVRVLDTRAIRAARREAVSFGSCSFSEPVDELHALGLI